MHIPNLHHFIYLKPFEEEVPPRLGFNWGSSLLILIGIILLVWYLIIRQRGKERVNLHHEEEIPGEEAPDELESAAAPVAVAEKFQPIELVDEGAAVEAPAEVIESPVTEATPVELVPLPVEAPVVEMPAVEAPAANAVVPTLEEVAPVEERVTLIPVQPDDLKVIEGIGPKIASLLNEAGITTFKQLSETAVSRLDEILVAAKLRRIADPGTWPEQARLAAEGKWDELKAFTDKLIGGRR